MCIENKIRDQETENPHEARRKLQNGIGWPFQSKNHCKKMKITAFKHLIVNRNEKLINVFFLRRNSKMKQSKILKKELENMRMKK